jgi:hypothetical protein
MRFLVFGIGHPLSEVGLKERTESDRNRAKKRIMVAIEVKGRAKEVKIVHCNRNSKTCVS